MSYQVLARKWRPRSFEDMVGQNHVVRALSNALEQDRLHHAYLFTGTRGVGKTTLARILSKALNCESGVSARPCGHCSACREIDEGRFVDLLEVDAASRTKVDQTRELLDNVPFAPVKGRFKVYLIDEVHMFSASSFNALLKTLEEPPPHVKFLLATTDPQKVPVTVLSRCLQFNLKRLLPDEIREQLAHILTTEGVELEDRALALLARAADGSMRDGLSLLDQAIAFGGGRVMEDDVSAMLGTVGRDMSLSLVRALADLDGARLLDEVARMHELTPDFGGVLQDLLGILHRIALYQQVPATLAEDDPERGQLIALAQSMDPEDVQLCYQIALLGQEDLPRAPDPRTGIEMVLLRMLAFRPTADAGSGGGAALGERKIAGSAQTAPASGPDPLARMSPPGPSPGVPVPDPAADRSPPARVDAQQGDGKPARIPAEHPATAALAAARLAIGADTPVGKRGSRPPKRTEMHQPPRATAPAKQLSQPFSPRQGAVQPLSVPPDLWPEAGPGYGDPVIEQIGPGQGGTPASVPGPDMTRSGESEGTAAPDPADAPCSTPIRDGIPVAVEVPGGAPTAAFETPRLQSREDWHELVARLDLGGVASELARNCELGSYVGQRLVLTLDPASQRLRVDTAEQRLYESLAGELGDGLKLEFKVSLPEGETPSQRRARERAERQDAAESVMDADPVAGELRREFGARFMAGTIAPTDKAISVK